MWANVNWNKLVQSHTPLWWRRPVFLRWLMVLISQVRELHNEFKALRTALLYDMRITGQTIYLEKALNDRFDPIDRGIYIENLEDLTQLYLYQRVEDQPPLWLYRKYDEEHLYGFQEYAIRNGSLWQAVIPGPVGPPAPGNPHWVWVSLHSPFLIHKNEAYNYMDFIVWVPLLLAFDEAEMQSLVTRYKISGKRFGIQLY